MKKTRRYKLALKIAGSVLGLLLLSVLVLVMVICSQQAQMLVRNPLEQRRPVEESPADVGVDYDDVLLTTEDGYRLTAWYIPSQNQAAIVLPTGYKNNRGEMVSLAHLVAQHGYGVVILDLRAHGGSEGDLISFGLHETRDMEAAYQYLLTRPDVDPERIGELGVSMGGVVVILHAAQNSEIKAIVVESAFASLEEEVATGVKAFTGLPPFPFAPLIQWFAEREAGFDADEVAAIEHIGRVSPRPILLLQGGADTIIPPDSGHRLCDAAGESCELWFEPDLGHSAFAYERPEEYEARVVAFFDRYLLGE